MVLNRVIGLRIAQFDTVADEIVLHQVGVHSCHDGQFLFLVLRNDLQPAGDHIIVFCHPIDFHPGRLAGRINDLVVGERKRRIGRQHMRPINRFLFRIRD